MAGCFKRCEPKQNARRDRYGWNNGTAAVTLDTDFSAEICFWLILATAPSYYFDGVSGILQRCSENSSSIESDYVTSECFSAAFFAFFVLVSVSAQLSIIRFFSFVKLNWSNNLFNVNYFHLPILWMVWPFAHAPRTEMSNWNTELNVSTVQTRF